MILAMKLGEEKTVSLAIVAAGLLIRALKNKDSSVSLYATKALGKIGAVRGT